jgi:hypothetical protein
VKTTLACAAAVTLVCGAAVAASAGTADGQGAQKRPLDAVTTDATDQCQESGSSDATTGAAFGFVILNAPGRSGATDRVTGEVALKKAGPSQVFSVFLAQDGNCVPAGMLTTNNQGNGNAHIDQPALGGTYYVVLQDVDMSERYASSPVALR